jgi:hypothetical protein
MMTTQGEKYISYLRTSRYLTGGLGYVEFEGRSCDRQWIMFLPKIPHFTL